MESLNEDILLAEEMRNNLTNLSYLKSKGIYFSNCYASATSTIMAISDFVNGDITCCENSNRLIDLELIGNESLFEVMRENGYENKFVSFPKLTAGEDVGGIEKIVDNNATIVFAETESEFKNEICKSIEKPPA